MTETKSQTDTDTDIRCKNMFTNSPCDYCDSESQYQIWDESAIGEVGRVEIMVACEEHTEEVSSELRRKRTMDD